MCLVKVYSEEFGEVFTNDFEIIKEYDDLEVKDETTVADLVARLEALETHTK